LDAYRPDAVALLHFLERNRRSFIFCLDEARRPIGYAMNHLGYRDGELLFTTYRKSAKVGHLLADPQLTCTVTSEHPDDAGRWVTLRGIALIYAPTADDIEVLMPASGSGDRRVAPEVGHKVRDRLLSGKRVLIRMAVTDVFAAYLSSEVTASDETASDVTANDAGVNRGA
jgi:hypothetical protein